MKKLLVTALLGLALFLSHQWWVTPTSAQSSDAFQDVKELTNEQFDAVNPLKITDSPYAETFSTPGGFLSRVIVFAFPAAGLILFIMMFWGGFETLAGSASKKNIDAGKQRIRAAIVGFILLFVSYWLIQLLEAIFDIKVL